MCQFRNTATGFGLISRVLHGLIATLVIIMLAVGTIMGDLANKDLKGQIFFLHKSTGLVVLSLGILFIIWSLFNTKPGYPSNMSVLQRKIAKSVHGLLYLLLLAMPFSGWIMSTAAGKSPTFYGLFVVPLPGIPQSKPLASFFAELHEIFAWSLFALICLHVLGALKHHFIDKDNILVRMYRQQ